MGAFSFFYRSTLSKEATLDEYFFDEFFRKFTQEDDGPPVPEAPPEPWQVEAGISMQRDALSERCRGVVEQGEGQG